ncbi:MAG: isochorismatase family cysteine hydrolase [Ilumatobacteraceae bacterium]
MIERTGDFNMGARNGFFSVEARPDAISFDAAQTAVVVVDMQNDFGDPHGMFGQAGIDLTGIRATVAPTSRVLAAARRAGIRVVYLKMAFQSDLSDAGAPDAPNWLKHLPMKAGESVVAPDGSPSRILIRDTWNTEIVDELRPEPDDRVLYKHRFSGFFETDLDAILKDWGIRNLVFTGCTTSVCVESTIKDAMFRDYHCLLLEDCTAEAIGAGLPRSNHDATLLVIQLLVGWVADSSAFLKAVESLRAVPAAT